MFHVPTEFYVLVFGFMAVCTVLMVYDMHEMKKLEKKLKNNDLKDSKKDYR